MKILSTAAIIVLGAYSLIMAIQFTAICVMLAREGISPFAPEAPAAFFTNFIAVGLSALAAWTIWRCRRQAFPIKQAQDCPTA